MYQRLRVCRNILHDQGVVLISIDDAETANTLQVCYEVFGEKKFVGTVIWKNATDNNPTNIAVEHESIHIFSKNKESLEKVWKSSVSDVKDILKKVGDELIKKHTDPDELQKDYTKWFRNNKQQLGPLDRYKYIDTGGIYTGSQSVHNPGKEGYRYDVLHPDTGKPCKQPLMGYRFPLSTMNRLLNEKRIIFGDDENKLIELKVYASEFSDKLSSVFNLDGRTGPYDLKELFPEAKKVFSNPKPVLLLERLVSFVTGPSDICVDLFAGSSTLSHSLMELGHKEGANRRFISIQYPELIDKSNKDEIEVHKFCESSGIEPFVSEISKERIRRAGKKYSGLESNPEWRKDTGFRVLKIDTSNMQEVYYQPGELRQDMLSDTADNIRPDRTPEDLLFQVLLDWGVDLSLPIARKDVSGKTVFFVDGSDKQMALAACFDLDIDEAFVKQLAEYEPLRAVFRDAGFANDSVKINVEQIFAQKSPNTEVKVI
jgi:adenine-specific DNA-methyltransferase